MKKLLSLLSVLTISGAAVPTTIAASSYEKQLQTNIIVKDIKVNNQQTNYLENLNRNKRSPDYWSERDKNHDWGNYRRNEGFGTWFGYVTKNNPLVCPPGQGCEILGDAGGHFGETAKGLWNYAGGWDGIKNWFIKAFDNKNNPYGF